MHVSKRFALVLLVCVVALLGVTLADGVNQAQNDAIEKLQREQSAEIAKLNAQIKALSESEAKAKEMVASLKKEIAQLTQLFNDAIAENAQAKAKNEELQQKLAELANNPFGHAFKVAKERTVETYNKVVAASNPYITLAQAKAREIGGPYYDQTVKYLNTACAQASQITVQDVKKFGELLYAKSMVMSNRIGKELVTMGVPAAYASKIAQSLVLASISLGALVILMVAYKLVSFFLYYFFCCCCCSSNKRGKAAKTK